MFFSDANLPKLTVTLLNPHSHHPHDLSSTEISCSMCFAAGEWYLADQLNNIGNINQPDSTVPDCLDSEALTNGQNALRCAMDPNLCKGSRRGGCKMPINKCREMQPCHSHAAITPVTGIAE